MSFPVLFPVPESVCKAQPFDSFYLYDQATILKSTALLQESFPQVGFLYSMKTNPHPQVVETVLSQGFGVDAASVGEVMLGVKFGVEKARIQYSAPGKTAQMIADTIGCATLIADSLREVSLIDKIAQNLGIVAKIGVRIHPSFSFDGGAPSPSKFGIDEALFFAQLSQLQTLEHVKIVGIHCHLRSQELDSSALRAYYHNLLSLAHRVQAKLGYDLTFFNMGSGIGIPYAQGDTALDVKKLGHSLQSAMSQFQKACPNTALYLESGRYAVGKAGLYVTRVLDKKVSCGETFVILHNTLNGFIRPSMVHLVTAYAQGDALPGNEPLFTSKHAFSFHAITDGTTPETVTLVGNLCTATDVVAKHITLPELSVGDLIVINNAGSYAAVLSPMQFSSQEKPAELFLRQDGTVV